jgi:hypothetical protein
MIALTRVESWRDGVLVHARTVPNANAARVYEEHEKALGRHTTRFHMRTETERSAA